MKANIRLINKRRIYSESFKRDIVQQFESGKFSVLQLEKLYTIPNATIYHWIYKYSRFNERGSRIIEMKESSTEKVKLLSARINELEQIVGQKQIKIDYLERMIALAKEELNIDIKKNYSTQPSEVSKTKEAR